MLSAQQDGRGVQQFYGGRWIEGVPSENPNHILAYPEKWRLTPETREYYAVDYGTNQFGNLSDSLDLAEQHLAAANAAIIGKLERPRGIAKITVQPL